MSRDCMIGIEIILPLYPPTKENHGTFGQRTLQII